LIQSAATSVVFLCLSQAVASEVRRLLVKDVMTKNPVTIDSEKTVRAAVTLDRSGVGCVLVTIRQDDHEKVIEIVTERDLVRRVLTKEGGSSEASVKSIMSSSLIVVDPNITIEEAAKVMERNRVRRLPVVDEAELAGVVAVSDLAKALAKQLEYSDAVFNAMARVSAPKGMYA
jgi:signal-transduction protein with cAMP-binding, CBS, and nucleotidyltransferase domain